MRLSFEPADIVNEVMSFGSPTPVEVAVSGPNFADNRALRREGPRRSWRRSRRSATCSYGQALDYPTVEVDDRPRAGGPERRDGRGRRPLAGRRPPRRAGSSCPTTGPTRRPASATRCRSRSRSPGHELGRARSRPIPVKRRRRHVRCCSATWPTSAEGTMPGEYDRYNMRRLVSLTANIAGRGPGPGGRAASPRRSRRPASRRAGCTVDVRGQIAPMRRDVPRAWRSGLALAVVVILLLLTAYFQSLRLALVVGRDGAGGAGRRGGGAAGSPARRSTSSRSWARSWPSAWRWPTRSCW